MCNLCAECPRSPEMIRQSSKVLFSEAFACLTNATIELPDLLNDVWRNSVSLQEITGRHRGSNVTQFPAPRLTVR